MLSRHSRLKGLPSLQISHSRQQSRHLLRPVPRGTAKGRWQQAQRWQARARMSASNKEEHLLSIGSGQQVEEVVVVPQPCP